MDIRGYVDVDVDVDVGGLDMPIIQSNPIHSEPYLRGIPLSWGDSPSPVFTAVV
jgi:hypothetical protein